MANRPRTFPQITPSGRSFDPGRFPQTVFQAQNGATTVMRYSNKRVDARLTLSFQNITNDKVEEILDNYISVNDDWDYVNFPPNHPALNGLDAETGVFNLVIPTLKTFIQRQPGGLRWRYTEPPVVTSVFPGISSVECSFNAYLDG